MAGIKIRKDWEVLESYFAFEELSGDPATPESGVVRIYAKDKAGASALYLIDDAGSVREIAPASTVTGTGTANRLAYWTSSSVIAANAALTATHILFADSNGLPVGDSGLIWNNTDKYLNTPLKFAVATGQPYTFSFRPGDLRLWTVQSQSSGAPFQLEFYTKDGDGTDSVGINFFVKGLPGAAADRELFQFYYDVGSLSMIIGSDAAGTGTVRPLKLITGSNSSQLVLNIDGTVSVRSHLIVGGGTGASELRLLEPSASGTNYSAFKAQAQAGDVTYTLPAADGSSGQVLSTNGSGTLSWATAGGSPAGSNTQVQFNNSGSFGASANFTWDGTDVGLGSGNRFRMQGQNRIRYLNSTAVASEDNTQAITTSTWTVVTFNDTDTFDTDTLHDTATNNSRVLARIAGKYMVYSYVIWEANVVGSRNLRLEKNAAGVVTAGTFIGGMELPASIGTNIQNTVTSLVEMAANDYIEAFVWQNSGGNLNIAIGGGTNPNKLGLIYLGE